MVQASENVEKDSFYLRKGKITKVEISDNIVKHQFPFLTSMGQQEAANQEGM